MTDTMMTSRPQGREASFDKPVLILGNGLSRLLYHREIMQHPGEVWGCNYVYLEYPERLSRLAGHVEVLAKAAQVAIENGYSYKVYGGNQGSYPDHFCSYTCPVEFRKDAGTTLVAQALSEGHSIIACGFDMGGFDVVSPQHAKFNKMGWIRRWQRLYQRYKMQWNVTFLGYDHTPIIRYPAPRYLIQKYNFRYQHMEPHINQEEYLLLFYAFYGVPQDIDERSEFTEVRWLLNPHEGKRLVLSRWYAKIEQRRGNCEIVKYVKKDEAMRRRHDLEIAVDHIVDGIYMKSLEAMAYRRGIPITGEMTKRELVQEIGRRDRHG